MPNEILWVYGWIALVLSGIFILIQIVILMEFVHNTAGNLIDKYRNSDGTQWKVVVLVITGTFYAISLALMGVTFGLFYECTMSIAFGVVNIGNHNLPFFFWSLTSLK